MFIYAATVCRFIKSEEEWPPQDLLDFFVPNNSAGHLLKWKHEIPSKPLTWELDEIYTQIVKHSFKGVRDERDKEKLAETFKQAIGSLPILSEPLSAIALAKLLYVRQETINARLRHLRSVLNIPDSQESPIRLLHPSFRDFLTIRDAVIKISGWTKGRHMKPWLRAAYSLCLSISRATSVA